MTVFVVVRRGNWMRNIVPWLAARCGSRVHGASWMSCALVFTMRCTQQPASCPLCKRSPIPLQRRVYHTLFLHVDAVHGVRALVDEPFIKTDVWMFIKLARVGDSQALTFFHHVSGMNYNFRGITLNFLPLLGFAVGVQRDNDMTDTTSVFCSEALTAFVQANGYDMGLTPCLTTPQMLVNALLTQFASELLHEQLMIDPRQPADAPIHARLIRVPSSSRDDDDGSGV